MATIDPRPRSRWKFSLRELFAATALSCLHLCAFVVLLRDVPVEQMTLIGGFVATILIGTLLGALLAVLRGKTRAGRLIACLDKAPHFNFWLKASLPLAVLIAATTGLLPVALSASQSASSSSRPGFLRLVLLVWLVQFFYINVWSSLRRPLAIHENGTIDAIGYFMPWRRIARRGWRLEPHGRLIIGRWPIRFVGVVPPEQRGSVEAVLAKNLGADARAARAKG